MCSNFASFFLKIIMSINNNSLVFKDYKTQGLKCTSTTFHLKS